MIYDSTFAIAHHGLGVVPIDLPGHEPSALMAFLGASQGASHAQVSAFMQHDGTRDAPAAYKPGKTLHFNGNSGADDPCDGDPNCVVIPGERPAGPDSDPPPPPYSGGSPSAGGGSADPAPCPPQHTSPLPTLAPHGVDVNALRNLVDDLAGAFDKMGHEGDIEHGVMIYADPAGHLRAGAIFTGDDEKVPMMYEPQPGETVVAWLHSHPAVLGVDEQYMSPKDTFTVQQMIADGEADPNMLSYIKDNGHGTAGVYEFQSNYKYNAREPRGGREVTTDVQPGPCPN